MSAWEEEAYDPAVPARPSCSNPMPRRSNSARFWEHVDRSGGSDSCWLWTGCTGEGGYGFFSWRYLDGRRNGRAASRCALELALGRRIPEHLEAAHSCRNRHCCNPAHLSEKTKVENEADKIRDGTLRYVLTEEQAKEILALYREHNPPSYSETGRQYSVGASVVRNLVLGITWKHLPERL